MDDSSEPPPVEFYAPALWLGMMDTHPGNGSKAGLVRRHFAHCLSYCPGPAQNLRLQSQIRTVNFITLSREALLESYRAAIAEDLRG